jgi:hypothetical protein
LITAAGSGFLATLLFTHDFYSGFFAFAFVALWLSVWALVEGRVSLARQLLQLHSLGATEKAVLTTTVVAAAWTLFLWSTGGVQMHIAGIRVASQDWRRPALLSLACVIAFIWLRGAARIAADVKAAWHRSRAVGDSWPLAVVLGGLAGVMVFLWVYLPAYIEHPRFPEQDLLNQIRVRAWPGWIRAFQDLNAYDTARSFKIVAVAAIVVCIPRLGMDRRTRGYVWWAAAVSAVVFLMPVRVDGLSIWLSFLQYLPGFSVIRDPTRIIFVYELAFILAAAMSLARFRQQLGLRAGICLLFVYFLITDHRVDRLVYERPLSVYHQWVEAAIDVDPACESFYVKRASAQYMSRSPNTGALYGGDSMFIALRQRLPTLNGYSAWTPDGWELMNPPEPTYSQRVRDWIQKNHLRNVCQLDLEARTMRIGPMD